MSKKIPVNRNQVWVSPATLDECVDGRDSARFVWDFVRASDLGSLGMVEDKSRERQRLPQTAASVVVPV
jgi:hypothetical protein